MPNAGLRFLLPLCCVFLGADPVRSQQATHVILMQVGDVYRSIQLHIPAGHDGDTPLPLVFNLHGSTSTAERQELMSGMFTVADQHQFLVAGGMAVYEYPQGRRTWNADLDPDGVNDVAYISAAIDAIDNKIAVDRKRVFATGMSGGGRMSSRIGCELAAQIAAIAPVAGVQFGDGCKPARPLPLLTFHGLDDPLNTYSGGNPERNPNWVASVEAAVSRWADANGCSEDPAAFAVTSEVTRLSYQNCADGADVVLYQVAGGGHTWPGSPLAVRQRLGVTNMGIDASALIWEFFAAHPLP